VIATFNRLVLRFRWPILALLLLATAAMAYQASRVRLESHSTDLFPSTHPYVATFHKYSDVFGNANRVAIMVEVAEGTIFNVKTLQKIQNVTRALEKVPGVNNNQLVSIASRKARVFGMRSTGLRALRVMWPNVPTDQAGADKVRAQVIESGYLYGTLVSIDEKAALIAAEFFETDFDAKRVYDQLQKIVVSERDDNTSLHMIGRPVLLGSVLAQSPRLGLIMAVTAAAMLLGLWLCFRNLGAVLAPALAAAMSALMGFGFVGLVDKTFDPLSLVIPFVITARALSHSAQMVSRFQQELTRTTDRVEAVQRSAAALFKPGLLAIVTDAIGVLLICLVPIPILQKLAFMGAFWLVSIFLSGMVFTPILLSLIPIRVRAPSRGAKLVDGLLEKIGKACTGRGRRLVFALTIVILGLSSLLVRRVVVGDVHHGTALLWPDSVYNVDTSKIAARFANTEQLTVVVEGSREQALKSYAVLQAMEAFHRHMEALPEVGATTSIVDLLPKMVSVFHGEDPKLNLVPDRQEQLNFFLRLLYTSGDRGDRDRYITPDHKSACITIYMHDHKGETLRKVVSHAQRFIDSHPLPEARFRLAGGYGGLLAAINEDLTRFDARITALAFLAVFLSCVVAFRSMLAGSLFLLPLVISNYLTYALMGALGIGLDVNVLPVVALGVALGVDYGLYVVQAIKDSFAQICSHADPHASTHGQVEAAVVDGVQSAGKGVLMTALTMLLGLIFWRFSFLRFQAEMGMLLLFWLSVSMLGGLVLLPALLVQFKPRFVFGS
jgi:predicted RND superfamily exporter protein